MSAQGFSQDLRQRQSQSLVLAPQLRQSLKILQVAALDLRSVIQEELQVNPTLEELGPDGATVELPSPADDHVADESTTGDDGDSATSDEVIAPDSLAGANGVDGVDGAHSDEMDFSKEFEILGKIDQDWRDHMATSGGAQPYTAEDAERRQHFFDSLVSETSLQEHLLGQAQLADLAPAVMDAMRQLIGSLDDRGFLTQTPADIALQAHLPLESVLSALKTLKTFDPPGIGSQHLAECLLAQLELKGRAGSLAARIVRDHFDLLARRRIPELARKLGAPPEEVQRAIEEIGKLDPAPGRRFAEDINRSVMPDVIVEKEGDEWKIHLNDDYIPRLRISSTYRDLIAKGTLSKAEREYLRERIRSGKFLIDSIEQRQRTIERITREIINAQKPFFEHGVSHLRPLTMTQIADVVGVHETTVSRALANKYIKTPHGVFEMKYFFTTGYQDESGAAVSNTSVKELIADLIATEDRSAPLSDHEIQKKLDAKGLKIARRTVAKYREELGILPSNLRRDFK